MNFGEMKSKTQDIDLCFLSENSANKTELQGVRAGFTKR